MTILIIQDLALRDISERHENKPFHSLSREEMARVHGGRAISVLVDGRPGGVVDDFQLNMAIFNGDIGVRVV